MLRLRWFFAIPLALAALTGPVHASSVRDEAHLFSEDALREARARLDRVERNTRIETVIETIDSLEGRSIDEVSLQRARESGSRGLFILIPKREHKIEVRVFPALKPVFREPRRLAIRDGFVTGFRRGDFDAGLRNGVVQIEETAAQARLAPPPGRRRGTFGISSLLTIALVIIGVLFLIRLLGSLFGGRGAYAGRPGMGPGSGPGYGGGGGGFLSSLFGGLGGAIAGNWLYDQFSGRHHSGYGDNASYGDSGQDSTQDGGGDWGGGGESADWGSDAGGGGGGGDWGGGGGGDWGGGGGGDWGGGGGGDW